MRSSTHTHRLAAALVAALVLAASSVAVTSPAGARVTAQARGFDGTTITVGGLGNMATVGAAQVGAKARIERFNKTHEIKGVKIDYVGFEDDKGDPATALTQARKLVTQDRVFAIVGDSSSYNPSEFLTQQKVPFFGWGYEKAYCAPKPTTSLWGFGYASCQVNTHPAVVVDFAGKVYSYVSQQLGKKHPTVAMIANDTDTGASTVHQNVIAYTGAGFDVVYSKATVPATPVADFSPYVGQLLTADHGTAPDVVTCLMALECVSIYNLMTAQGFKGIFQHALYTDFFVKPFKDTIVTASNANLSATDIPALARLKTDLAAVAPNTKLDGVIFSGYSSTDMFIQALKKAAKRGKSGITPQNIQKIASKMTWQLKGLTGPTVYPTATNREEPYCTGLFKSDGTQWVTVAPYSCSSKTYPFKAAK